MAPLILNATVSGSRVTISFLHKVSATNYFKYLKYLEKSFYEDHEFKFEIKTAESESMVSMDIPSGITAEPRERPKVVILAFNDPQEAVVWESKMIVWEKTAGQEEKKRTLSRSLGVEEFNKRLFVELKEEGINIELWDVGMTRTQSFTHDRFNFGI
jgi:hypothetical protein